MQQRSDNLQENKRYWTLQLCALYFALCGLSAIFWPQSWYLLAGVVDPQFNLGLAITGGMMLGLSAGAWIAAKSPTQSKPMVAALLVANAADLLIVSVYLLNGTLPLVNAAGFILLDLVWIVALVRTQKI